MEIGDKLSIIINFKIANLKKEISESKMVSLQECYECRLCGRDIPKHNKKLHEIRCDGRKMVNNQLIVDNENSNQTIYENFEPVYEDNNRKKINTDNYPSQIDSKYKKESVNPDVNFDISSRYDDNRRNSGINIDEYPSFIHQESHIFDTSFPNLAPQGPQPTESMSNLSQSKFDLLQSRLDFGDRHKDTHGSSICPRCTERIPDKSLEQHSIQCSYKNCRYCFEYYPAEILNDHLQFCEMNPGCKNYEDYVEYTNQSEQQNNEYMEENSYEDDLNGYEDSEEELEINNTRNNNAHP